MEAGRLRQRIAVDQPLVTQNSTGEEIVTWTPVTEVWGSVEPLSGREALQASAIAAQFDTRIRLRWSQALSGMTAKWRLRHRGVSYNIFHVANVDMRDREIEIQATSGLNEG